jgi:hypothetical protein
MIQFLAYFCNMRLAMKKSMKRTGLWLPGINAMIDVYGVIAQLVERYNGIVEVDGSIPSGSTIRNLKITA